MITTHSESAPEQRATAKAYRHGTHRTVTPGQTVAHMQPFLHELGITRVANVTGLDVIGVPTVMVTRPNGRSLSVHQGKGADLAAAQASGIMEATEHHLAEHIAPAPLLATTSECRGRGRVVDVERLPGSVRALQAGDRIGWIQGEALSNGDAVWVPFELVHLDLRLPLPSGSGFFALTSNGLASGNQRAEAVVHGLCELIERDALTLFYQEPVSLQAERRIALDRVEDFLIRSLLERFNAAGVEVAVWDITSDLGVACLFCMAVDRVFDPFRPIASARGSGAHPDRVVALSRALCEAAQSRLTQIVGARDDLQSVDLEGLRTAQANARTLEQMRSGAGQCEFEHLPTLRTHTLEEDITYLRQQLQARGMEEIIVVDLSRPHLPCSVVRVVVPGLESVFASPTYRPGARARACSRAST